MVKSINSMDTESECNRWIREHLGYIIPHQDDVIDFEYVVRKIHHAVMAHGVTIFLIDPWNQVLMSKRSGQSTTEYVNECIMRLKRLAKRLNIIIAVAHHIRKPDGEQEPTEYDLADSAHWANGSDHVLLVHMPDKKINKTRVWVPRSKNFETMGRPGGRMVAFVTAHAKLLPVGDDA